MAQALWMRLREVQWKDYEVSEGSSERLEKILQDLASRKRARAMKASHDVWRMLCRNGVRSAAVVVVPYLVEIIEISTEDVQLEIADILKSCVVGVGGVRENWQDDLVRALQRVEPELRRYHKKATGDYSIALSGVLDLVEDL
ncbi:hypothetical protein ACFPK9_09950 [Rubritalea spongiae]|uniref:Uncharacterized protein n=1 Tax=Rubritalea spongiae TaxID=430797 RepID=A0ABW5DZ38_9BACT